MKRRSVWVCDVPDPPDAALRPYGSTFVDGVASRRRPDPGGCDKIKGFVEKGFHSVPSPRSGLGVNHEKGGGGGVRFHQGSLPTHKYVGIGKT